MKKSLVLAIIFGVCASFGVVHALDSFRVLAQTTSCPLQTLLPYKTPQSPAVYYISEDCKKRPIRNPNVYFSHFSSWKDVRVTSSATLNRIPDHELSFLPWGPRRVFENGSLVKTVSDSKVYILLGGDTIYPIASEAVFRTTLGFSFNQIEDVAPSVMQKYGVGTPIAGVESIPSALVFKYPSDSKVYALERPNGAGDLTKRYVASMAQLATYQFRADRIATLPPSRAFADATGIALPITPLPGPVNPAPNPVTPNPSPSVVVRPPSPPPGVPGVTPSPSPTPSPTPQPSPSPIVVAPVPPPSTETAWPPRIPSSFIMTVRETAGVQRSGEILRSGVPLPKSVAIRNTANLGVVDSSGNAVPAEFIPLARWNGSLTSNEPIKWLMVSFPASVSASGLSTYRLVTNGSARNPASETQVRLTRSGNSVTVNTGAGEFVINGDNSTLFEEIRSAAGVPVARGGQLSATVGGVAGIYARARRVTIEHSDSLSAVVVVEGEYTHPQRNGGGMGTLRRYVFTAGSPTVQVRQTLAWEGDAGYNGYVRVSQLRDTLVPVNAPTEIFVRGERSRSAFSTSGEVSLVQSRRNTNTEARRYTLTTAAQTQTGTAADGAYIAAKNSVGTIAITLPSMHLYEPQALRVLSNGTIALDLVNEEVPLGNRQGLFANFSVSVLPTAATASDVERLAWGTSVAPLHAWPSPEWFASSEAVPEMPYGQLPTQLASFTNIQKSVLESTLQNSNQFGLYGLMTYGLYPRNWANPINSNEVAQGTGPTANETWDDVYWGTTWTDYHNASKLGAYFAMQSGETEWLERITAPAAWRMLYTQIMQCGPDDAYFYCGQAPAGYNGYRSDFNSSHAYFDNLFLYSYLFADQSVVPIITRGANNMRGYICPGRANAAGPACDPTVQKFDEYAAVTGRSAMQYANIFHYLGTSSRDGSYLEDWESLLARAVTQYYVEPVQQGVPYGFWASSNARTGNTASGALQSTDQQWMLSLYDMEALYNYSVETGDQALGSPPIRPSRIITNWGRTLTRFGGGGSPVTAEGTWPNGLRFRYSGERIGGTLEQVEGDRSGSDPTLYVAGKADLLAVLARAADWSKDTDIKNLASNMTQFVLRNLGNYPLGKEQGLMLARLPVAVARLTSMAGKGEVSLGATVGITPPPAPTPNPTPTTPPPTPPPPPATPPPPPSASASTGLPESTYTPQGGQTVTLVDGHPFAPAFNLSYYFEHSLGTGTCFGTDFVEYDFYLRNPGASNYERIGGHTGSAVGSFSGGHSMESQGCAKGRFLYHFPASAPSGAYSVGVCITNTTNRSERYCTTAVVTKP